MPDKTNTNSQFDADYIYDTTRHVNDIDPEKPENTPACKTKSGWAPWQIIALTAAATLIGRKLLS